MWWCTANGGMRRRCQYLIGNPVRLLLVNVSRLVDGQSCLDCSRLRRMYGDPAEIVTESVLDSTPLLRGRLSL